MNPNPPSHPEDPPSHPEKLWQAVDQRLDVTLRTLGVPPVSVEPLSGPALTGPQQDPRGTVRLRRGVRITSAPPGTDMFATAAGLWRQGGCQVGESRTGYGRTLIAHDPQGYVLSLTLNDSGAPAVVIVASPPISGRRGHLVVGIVIGAILGPAVSCLSFLTALGGVLGSSQADASPLLAWIWVPLLLVVGGLLMISPSTRRFGTGLMIGVATTGIVTSGFCTSLILQ